jgi:hypothetical protein
MSPYRLSGAFLSVVRTVARVVATATLATAFVGVANAQGTAVPLPSGPGVARVFVTPAIAASDSERIRKEARVTYLHLLASGRSINSVVVINSATAAVVSTFTSAQLAQP